MTNEEAIKGLKKLRSFHNGSYGEHIDMAIKALETTCIEDYPTCTECEHYDSEKHYCPRFCQVIKDTLAEAQPSEDTEVIKVSKGAVKARQGRFVIYDVNWFKEHFYSEEMIYGQPKQPSEDCISRKQALDDKGLAVFHRYDDYVKMRNYLKALPYVTPQRPKGKWIIKGGKEQGYDIAGVKTWYIQIMCDKCGFIKTPIEGHMWQYHYCPNCGAEMSGGGEGEVSD